MKFKEYDVVRLKCDVPGQKLKKGDTGTVLIVFGPQSDEYEVEFCDSDGITLALATLKGNQLEVVWTEI